MRTKTIGHKKALQDFQEMKEYACDSQINSANKRQEVINGSYYRGNQWLDRHILKDMQEIGATPYTYNNIQSLVNAFVSLQIRSSKRVGYDATSDNPTHVKMAEYLRQLAYSIQTQNDHVFASTNKFTSALLSGVGWSSFCYKDGKFVYEHIPSKEVYFDPDDKSAQLDDSNFVCRVHYVPFFKLKKMYPEFVGEFEQMIEETKSSDSFAYDNSIRETAIWENTSNSYDLNTEEDGKWSNGRSIKIVEIYYKKDAKYFETDIIFPEQPTQGEIQEEKTYATFDESIAKEKSISGKVEKKDGTQIWHGVYCDNLLLKNEPIEAQIPNQKYFPLTPVVYKRDYQGVPYGVVDNLIPLQKTHNFLWSTTLHYLDAKTLIASDEQVDTEKLRDFLKDEMRSKNGVAFIKNPKELQIIDHEKNLDHRMRLIERNYREFETQTGLYDELKGEQTNAVSGVAISQRATNSMNAQNPLVLAYENMIVSEGKAMLDTIKGINNFRYSVKFFKEGQSEIINLDDSIALVGFEVYTDISPNFASSAQEEKARFAELINAPNSSLILSSPLFLRELGFREENAYELSEEYLRITGMMQQAEQQKAQEEEMQKQQEEAI